MRPARASAAAFLALVCAAAAAGPLLLTHDYAAQFREHPNQPPSPAFLLGTDDLGRDRLARLLQGARISLVCAPVAAFAATLLGAACGLAAGYLGGWVDQAAATAMDLFLSLPWLFVLLTVRALLPLDVSPAASIASTTLLLAALGWAPGARMVRASVAAMRSRPFLLYAQACGKGGWRLLVFHVLPNLRPVLAAQFWILVPVYLLAEANLGVLGLGIAEPVPSWGGLLAELQSYDKVREAPWILAPAVLLVLVIGGLHFVVSGQRTWE